MHNIGLNTSVQSWSKTFAWTFALIFFFAHIFCFFIGLVIAPQLYSSSSIAGQVCHQRKLTLQDGEGVEKVEALSNCLPLGKVAVPPAPLEETIVSFRFPQESDEVSFAAKLA